jgi:hypothetical protein
MDLPPNITIALVALTVCATAFGMYAFYLAYLSGREK